MQFKLYKFEENFDEKQLHPSIVEHCNKYTDPTMRKISKFAYLKMIELADEAFETEFKDEEIIFEGKPHFANKPDVFFNITHEDNIIGVVVSEKECGIDLARKVTNLKLAQKILSKDEYEDFEKAIDKEDFIARKWAMKEAYAKKEGVGLSDKIFRQTINVKISKVTFHDKEYYLCISE
ncbi:MAG: 4'-phosphopantetheinyl transferase superfamily protein [Acholeplasmatales bacterium]|nr:4'-phosphopantetheinyl transferase superfamily protein [Acholeplasmatales bacterium]